MVTATYYFKENNNSVAEVVLEPKEFESIQVGHTICFHSDNASPEYVVESIHHNLTVKAVDGGKSHDLKGHEITVNIKLR